MHLAAAFSKLIYVNKGGIVWVHFKKKKSPSKNRPPQTWEQRLLMHLATVCTGLTLMLRLLWSEYGVSSEAAAKVQHSSKVTQQVKALLCLLATRGSWNHIVHASRVSRRQRVGFNKLCGDAALKETHFTSCETRSARNPGAPTLFHRKQLLPNWEPHDYCHWNIPKAAVCWRNGRDDGASVIRAHQSLQHTLSHGPWIPQHQAFTHPDQRKYQRQPLVGVHPSLSLSIRTDDTIPTCHFLSFSIIIMVYIIVLSIFLQGSLLWTYNYLLFLTSGWTTIWFFLFFCLKSLPWGATQHYGSLPDVARQLWRTTNLFCNSNQRRVTWRHCHEAGSNLAFRMFAIKKVPTLCKIHLSNKKKILNPACVSRLPVNSTDWTAHPPPSPSVISN